MEKAKEMDLIPLFHHHNWTLELVLHWGGGGSSTSLHRWFNSITITHPLCVVGCDWLVQ